MPTIPLDAQRCAGRRTPRAGTCCRGGIWWLAVLAFWLQSLGASAAPLSGSDLAPIGALAAPSLHARSAVDTPPLRVVMLRAAQQNLPHRDIQAEIDWLSEFARTSGRQLTVATVSRSDDLPRLLRSGAQDLIVGDLPPSLLDADDLRTSESFHAVRYQLVGPADAEVASPLGLAGKRIALRLSSPLWPYFERLAAQFPETYVAALPEYLTQAEVLGALSRREYDFTVIPAAGGVSPLENFPSLAVQFDLTSPLPVGFVARQTDVDLLTAIDARLRSKPLYASLPDAQPRNLEAVKQSGVLRVITQPNGQSFYLRDGQPGGFEFELARHFAANLGVTPEFVLAESETEMLDWLAKGVGDLVTMPLGPDAGLGEPGVAFSREYHFLAPTLVSRADAPITELAGLSGRRIGAEAGTAAWRALKALRRSQPDLDFTLVKLPSPLSVDDGLSAVRRTGLDALVVEGQRLGTAEVDLADLELGPSLPNPYRYRWGYRAGDEAMSARIEKFMQRGFRRGTFASASARYFDHQHPGTFDTLTPYDALLQEYAARYQFDWRLLAAVVYQESRFNSEARSPDGARGLMQLMPETAAALGFSKLADPAESIHAGTKYLATLRDRFDRRLPLRERTWFALASYNAGPARLNQARERAVALGLDRDVWFDNVEVAMARLGQSAQSMLSEPDPDCWCSEPVNYVRQVSRFYDNYRTFSRIAAARSSEARPLAELSGAVTFPASRTP